MYRFKKHHRQFKPGDSVPSTFDAGIIGTMLGSHIIELATEPDTRDIRDVPNKAILASGPGTKVRRK